MTEWKVSRWFVACVLSTMVLLIPSPVSAQLSLDVMTFNIRTASGRDGDNAWPNRKALLVETIERSAPQVIGMQEALGEQIAYLERMLPAYRWIGIDRGLNGGVGLSEATPIFYRYAELSPIESGNFWLTETPDTPPVRRTEDRRRGGGRIVTWARFYHRASGREIYVFNTHFTLRRDQSQLDSAALVIDRVSALPADAAVIVMGDFNNGAEDSDTWRAATAGRLRDAWTEADARVGPLATYGDFGPPEEALAERVDWILVGGPIDVRRAETVVHNDDGRYPSDHYPVVAALVIP
ncbi:MAG: endonuclease/exonuclease/phosphatase family protein [Acidobacteria bacterium]|nr:endonuclease/exonuclease/phosphatase family protein [Acidobacteriota bacterium]